MARLEASASISKVSEKLGRANIGALENQCIRSYKVWSTYFIEMCSSSVVDLEASQ